MTCLFPCFSMSGRHLMKDFSPSHEDGTTAGTSPVGEEVSAARAELPLWVRLDACGHHGPLSSS